MYYGFAQLTVFCKSTKAEIDQYIRLIWIKMTKNWDIPIRCQNEIQRATTPTL